ncbi:cyclin-dependent protein kinase inhibitor SMR10-like [Salvia divinorum]|uniref:Cyclin-dependent protein kinase inhibitor SMR10-like n=1 Tax=Salvia divinorum TaxID=28513 RepID=A0ABD1HNM6_SALDI
MGVANKMSCCKDNDSHATTKRRVETLARPEASTPPLKIRVPDVEDEDGGCTTPKAADRGDPLLPKCPPPPPRKPKSVPLLHKRKAQMVCLLDLSDEIDSMFPSNILRDFMCGKIKKIRTQIL